MGAWTDPVSDTRNVSVPLLYPAFYLYLGEQSGICSKYVERYSAVLGYSNIGYELNVPSFVKVMELNFPYQVMFHIFGLMLGYSIVMAESYYFSTW